MSTNDEQIFPDGYRAKGNSPLCEEECGVCETCHQSPWWWGGEIWAGDFQNPTRFIDKTMDIKRMATNPRRRGWDSDAARQQLETAAAAGPEDVWVWQAYSEDNESHTAGFASSIEEAAKIADAAHQELSKQP